MSTSMGTIANAIRHDLIQERINEIRYQEGRVNDKQVCVFGILPSEGLTQTEIDWVQKHLSSMRVGPIPEGILIIGTFIDAPVGTQAKALRTELDTEKGRLRRTVCGTLAPRLSDILDRQRNASGQQDAQDSASAAATPAPRLAL